MYLRLCNVIRPCSRVSNVRNVVNPNPRNPRKNEMAADFDCAVCNRSDSGARCPRPVRGTRHTEDRDFGRSEERLP